jgi:hypothetical protein
MSGQYINEHFSQLFLDFKKWLDIAECLDGSFDRFEHETSLDSLIEVEKAFNKMYPKYKFCYAKHNEDCDDCCCDYSKWCVMTITVLETGVKYEHEYKWAAYSKGREDLLYNLIEENK